MAQLETTEDRGLTTSHAISMGNLYAYPSDFVPPDGPTH